MKELLKLLSDEKFVWGAALLFAGILMAILGGWSMHASNLYQSSADGYRFLAYIDFLLAVAGFICGNALVFHSVMDFLNWKYNKDNRRY